MESGDSHGPSAWGLEVCWDGGAAVLPGLRVVELDAVVLLLLLLLLLPQCPGTEPLLSDPGG